MSYRSDGAFKRLHMLAWPIMVGLSLLFASVGWRPQPQSSAHADPSPIIICRAELRSWVVIGKGRHLYLDIQCPIPHENAIERLEYTTLINRSDYRYTADASGEPRVGRHRGTPLRPPPLAPMPDDRLEALYEVTLDQARCLRRDRIFDRPYMLVGANSNAALRKVMEGCGLALPSHVLAGAGILGTFPGIDADAGSELPETAWSSFGILPE